MAVVVFHCLLSGNLGLDRTVSPLLTSLPLGLLLFKSMQRSVGLQRGSSVVSLPKQVGYRDTLKKCLWTSRRPGLSACVIFPFSGTSSASLQPQPSFSGISQIACL